MPTVTLDYNQMLRLTSENAKQCSSMYIEPFTDQGLNAMIRYHLKDENSSVYTDKVPRWSTSTCIVLTDRANRVSRVGDVIILYSKYQASENNNNDIYDLINKRINFRINTTEESRNFVSKFLKISYKTRLALAMDYHFGDTHIEIDGFTVHNHTNEFSDLGHSIALSADPPSKAYNRMNEVELSNRLLSVVNDIYTTSLQVYYKEKVHPNVIRDDTIPYHLWSTRGSSRFFGKRNGPAPAKNRAQLVIEQNLEAHSEIARIMGIKLTEMNHDLDHIINLPPTEHISGKYGLDEYGGIFLRTAEECTSSRHKNLEFIPKKGLKYHGVDANPIVAYRNIDKAVYNIRYADYLVYNFTDPDLYILQRNAFQEARMMAIKYYRFGQTMPDRMYMSLAGHVVRADSDEPVAFSWPTTQVIANKPSILVAPEDYAFETISYEFNSDSTGSAVVTFDSVGIDFEYDLREYLEKTSKFKEYKRGYSGRKDVDVNGVPMQVVELL